MTDFGHPVARLAWQPLLGLPIANRQHPHAHCYRCGQPGQWAHNCPKATIASTLHQPLVQTKISQVGDTTVLNHHQHVGNAEETIGKILQGQVSFLPRTTASPPGARISP